MFRTLTHTSTQLAHIYFSSQLHDLVISIPSCQTQSMQHATALGIWQRQCDLVREALSCKDLSHSCGLTIEGICVMLEVWYYVYSLCRYQGMCDKWKINIHVQMFVRGSFQLSNIWQSKSNYAEDKQSNSRNWLKIIHVTWLILT